MAMQAQIDPTMQILLNFLGGSQSGSQTGNKSQSGSTTSDTTTTTNGSQTVKSTADLGRLQDVFSQLVAGPTQQDISTIFRQGAKEVPALQSAFAQATGLQNENNSILANALGDLNSRMEGKVLDLKTAMLGQAADVAKQIGTLTQEQTSTTSNTNTQKGGTTSTLDEKSGGSNDLSTSINSDKMRQLLLGGTLAGLLGGESNGGIGPGLGALFKVISNGGSISDLFKGMTVDPNGIGIGDAAGKAMDALRNFDAGKLLSGGDFNFGDFSGMTDADWADITNLWGG